MTTRKAGETSENLKGLARTVAEAQHPTMKLLGQRAIALGFSQERLAKEMRDRFDLSDEFNGANVRGHFLVKRPQAETVRRYCEILSLGPDQVQVILEGRLERTRLQYWQREVFRVLGIFRSDFAPGTASAIRSALRDPTIREKVLTETALGWGGPVDPGWSSIPSPLDGFARVLHPMLDLRSFVRKATVGSSALFMIYTEALGLYGSSERALAFVDACSAILRIDGFDTRPMYDFLKDTLRGTRSASRKGTK